MVRVSIYAADNEARTHISPAAEFVKDYLMAQVQYDLIDAGRDAPCSRYPAESDQDLKWEELRRRWLIGDAWIVAVGAGSHTTGPLADFFHRCLNADDQRRRPFIVIVGTRHQAWVLQADALTVRLVETGNLAISPPVVLRDCSRLASCRQLSESSKQRLRKNADWLVKVTQALQGLS